MPALPGASPVFESSDQLSRRGQLSSPADLHRRCDGIPPRPPNTTPPSAPPPLPSPPTEAAAPHTAPQSLCPTFLGVAPNPPPRAPTTEVRKNIEAVIAVENERRRTPLLERVFRCRRRGRRPTQKRFERLASRDRLFHQRAPQLRGHAHPPRSRRAPVRHTTANHPPCPTVSRPPRSRRRIPPTRSAH